MFKKMDKLRISARPDGKGWLDLSYQGKPIGSIKDSTFGTHLLVTGNIKQFCISNNITPPKDPGV